MLGNSVLITGAHNSNIVSGWYIKPRHQLADPYATALSFDNANETL